MFPLQIGVLYSPASRSCAAQSCEPQCLVELGHVVSFETRQLTLEFGSYVGLPKTSQPSVSTRRSSRRKSYQSSPFGVVVLRTLAATRALGTTIYSGRSSPRILTNT